MSDIENEFPNRGERRRQEKEQVKWNEAEWGKRDYREFDKCPVCGCPNRYALEAMKGEMPEEQMRAKPPALVSFEYNYEGPISRTKLAVVADSCCKCGAMITIARSKTKQLMVGQFKKGDIHPFMWRG